jgi:sugar phosphate isomerase/epimerase
MSAELLATCWTHAGDASPEPGRDLSPLSLRTRAEAAAAAGFTGIGFLMSDLAVARDELGYPAVRRMFDDLGLRHVELEFLEHWWALDGRRQKSDDQRRQMLEAAEQLGAHHIKIAPSIEMSRDQPAEPLELDLWARELQDLAQQAADAGTSVALEFLPMSNVPTVEVGLELVRTADHPAAGLCVDIWHVERGGSTMSDVAAIPVERILAVELDDAPAQAEGHLYDDTLHNRVLCGEGSFDVVGFVKALDKTGYRGPFGVEILSSALRRQPVEEATAAAYRTAAAEVRRARDAHGG